MPRIVQPGRTFASFAVAAILAGVPAGGPSAFAAGATLTLIDRNLESSEGKSMLMEALTARKWCRNFLRLLV